MTSPTDGLDRARGAYRLERLRIAGLGALPALVYPAVAAGLGVEWTRLALGMALFAVAAVAVFVGGRASRGAGLGLLLAAVPFGAATLARGGAHVCIDGACMAACLPACAASGFVAGALGAFGVVRLRGGLPAFGVMITLLLLAGGTACHCVGYASLMALTTGLVVTALPALPRMLADSR